MRALNKLDSHTASRLHTEERHMMTRKDFEHAATIAQRVSNDALRSIVVASFVALFTGDNPRFDAERFERACEPGRNVRARS
jgi:hypothetical protein